MKDMNRSFPTDVCADFCCWYFLRNLNFKFEKMDCIFRKITFKPEFLAHASPDAKCANGAAFCVQLWYIKYKNIQNKSLFHCVAVPIRHDC